MEALIGLATAGTLFALVLWRPAYGVAMALCMPMIHPAIGSDASFLGVGSPAILFGGAVCRVILMHGHAEQLRLCFVDMAMLGWIAYLPVSVLLNVGDHPREAVEAAVRLAYMGFSFYASVRLLCYSNGVGAFCRDFALAMVVFGVFITLVALSLQENASQFVTRLTIGRTYIGLSIFITLALLHAVFMLFFMREHLSRLERVFVLASTPLLFYGVLLCNTRGVVVALVLVVVLLLFRAVFSSRLSAAVGRRAAIGLLGAAVLAIGTAMAFPDVWARMGDKFEDLTLAGGAAIGESDSTRLELFGAALRMFAEAPVFGHGIGAFEMEMNTYPHNLVLQVMAETGLIGLCLLAMIALGSVFLTLQYQSVNALFINALVVFQLLESLVSLSFWMHKNLFVFMAMAVAHHLYQLAPRSGASPRRSRKRRRRAGEPRILAPATN